MQTLKLFAVSGLFFSSMLSAADLITLPNFVGNGNVALTTDYMYRGISQSSNNAAVQGGLGLTHKSGVYVNAWGSSIASAYGGMELDLFLGYNHKFETLRGAMMDVGIQRYNYPGINKGNNNGLAPDFTEYYLSGKLDNTFVRGDAVKGGIAYANRYINSSGRYWNVTGEYTAPVTSLFGIVGRVGYNKLANDESLGRVLNNVSLVPQAKPRYWDYKAGVTAGLNGFVADLSYVGSNIKAADCPGSICDGRTVFSLSKVF